MLFRALFAATAIRSGGVNSTNRIRYESSLRTQQALHILGMSIIFDFAERNEKQNNIRQQGEYFDKGRSHPNIELRILATLAIIDPSMEQSLRSYLRSRRGDIEPYISLEYSKMQSINLLKIIKNDENSWHEKITAIEVLSERRNPIAVSAIKRIIESGNNIVDPERRSKRRTLINDMIRYLGKVGDKGSIKLFKDILINDYGITTKLAALYAIESLGDSSMVNFLESLHSEDEMLRSAVESTINRLQKRFDNDSYRKNDRVQITKQLSEEYLEN